MTTTLTIEIPGDGVPAKLYDRIEDALRVEYYDHPGMRYGARRVWNIGIDTPSVGRRYPVGMTLREIEVLRSVLGKAKHAEENARTAHDA